MQVKEQKISPIKQRILQYAKSTPLSMRDFYKKTGISRGTLESNTGITEDTITKVIAAFNDISPLWLLTGDGEMLVSHSSNVQDKKESAVSEQCAQCELRNKLILQQEETIELLKYKIQTLGTGGNLKNKKSDELRQTG